MKKIALLFLLIISVSGCSTNKSEQNIYALIVSKDGIIKEEKYFNGKSETDLMNVQSITKSILSLLIGIAIDSGQIENEEIPIYTFFPEYVDLFDSNKKQITIRHLLNHTSGLNWKGYKEHDSFLASQDQIKFILQKELVEDPGQVYNYNSGGTHLLSAIIEKATGESTMQFAQDKLFLPLEIFEINWDKLNDGFYDGAGFGLEMRPLDLVKIGALILNNGLYDGERVISSNWINKSININAKKETKWGIRNSLHGYGWYIANYQGEEITYSMGYGGQFIFILPTKNLVIVTSHNTDTLRGIGQQVAFIKHTLPEILSRY